MVSDADPLLAAVDRHAREALRSVSIYDQQDYDILFLRGDVDQRYGVDEIEAVFDELVLSGMGLDYLEGLFHAGSLECSIYGFEEAVTYHTVIDQTAGVFITFDRALEIDLDAFITDVNEAIEASELV